MENILQVKNLHVCIKHATGMEDEQIQKQSILNGIDLALNQGEVHAIMGPNGSGKSTLALTLMGHPRYTITDGSITFDDQDLTKLPVDKRSKAGLFLAFQTPLSIEGISLREFLYQSYQAKFQGTGMQPPPVIEFEKLLVKNLELLSIDPTFVERHLNIGLSGGEKKQAEILQLAILQPKLAILDEIDSGLDVDSLKRVCQLLNKIKAENKAMTLLVITHYPRILHYLVPDIVHVIQDGIITQSGDKSLAEQVESEGYRQ